MNNDKLPSPLDFRVRARPVVEVVDTNGAGDGFMAGFLAAHLAGADVAAAMVCGAEQAASALSTVHLHPLLEPPSSTRPDHHPTNERSQT